LFQLRTRIFSNNFFSLENSFSAFSSASSLSLLTLESTIPVSFELFIRLTTLRTDSLDVLNLSPWLLT